MAGRILLILIVVFGCIAIALSGVVAKDSFQLREEVQPRSVVLEGGVFVSPAAVKSVFGDRAVTVKTSPPGSETFGAKSVAADGSVTVWVPSTFAGGVTALTPSEAQEYVLRSLAQCSASECVFDAVNTPLDAGVLTQMAADENVDRGETSQLFGTFVTADLAKYALDKQAEVAMHGMDRIRDVSQSGDIAQTATVAAFTMRDSAIALAVALMGIVFIVLFLKGKKA